MRSRSLMDAFLGTGPRQPFVELGQGVLEASGEALDDGALLVGALFGEAVLLYPT